MLNPDIRSGTTIDAATFREALQFIRPCTDELSWQAIPWRTDLFDAVDVARTERKPVLLWTMNGNPLGCT